MPLISVLLSNYNHSAVLCQSVDSVLAQTYDDYELIIVDDGSTDASPRIISELADRHAGRVRALLEPRNEGQGAGFNKGLAASTGELICLLDSDDLWMPEKLARLVAFRQDVEPAAVYQHNLYLLKDGQKTAEPYQHTMVCGDVFESMRRSKRWPVFAPTSGLAFPRAVLEAVLPIPPEFRTCADGFLTRTAICHGVVASRHESWGYYRVHPANNVFGSEAYDAIHYQYSVLLPALNAYYARIGAPLRFPHPTLNPDAETLAGRAVFRAKRRAILTANWLAKIYVEHFGRN